MTTLAALPNMAKPAGLELCRRHADQHGMLGSCATEAEELSCMFLVDGVAQPYIASQNLVEVVQVAVAEHFLRLIGFAAKLGPGEDAASQLLPGPGALLYVGHDLIAQHRVKSRSQPQV